MIINNKSNTRYNHGCILVSSSKTKDYFTDYISSEKSMILIKLFNFKQIISEKRYL